MDRTIALAIDEYKSREYTLGKTPSVSKSDILKNQRYTVVENEIIKHWTKKIKETHGCERPGSSVAAEAYADHCHGFSDMGVCHKSFLRKGESEYKNNMRHVNARERLRAKLEKRKQKC